MDARTLAEQLKEIDAKMTPGKWSRTGTRAASFCPEQPYVDSEHGNVACMAPLSEYAEADALGIAELRNLLPNIIETLKSSSWVKITDDPNSLPKLAQLPCLYIDAAGKQQIGRPIRYDRYWQPLPAPPEADTK